MRTTLTLLTLSIALSWGAQSYTLQDFLGHAFTHSETLKGLEAEVKKVESIEKEYRGKGAPTIEGTAGYQYAINQAGMPLSFGDMSGVSFTNGLTPGASLDDTIIAGTIDGLIAGISGSELLMPKNSFSMGVSLYQPVFVQGKVMTGIKIAKIYKETMFQKYRDAQFSLAEEIIDAYYAAVVAQENRTIRVEGLTLATSTHELALKRLRTGQGNVLDTLNTRFGMQKATYVLREADKNVRLALENLCTKAALTVSIDSITLSDTLSAPAFNLSEAQASELLLSNNSTIQLLTLAEELQSKMTTLAKTDYLPSLFVGASANWISQFEGSDDFRLQDEQKLFASLTVPLFNGGQRSQKVSQSQYDEESLREKKSLLTRQLKLALSASFEEYEVALKELEETKQLTALSTEGLRVSTLSFQVGQITQLDLSQSEQQYNMAQLAYFNALYKLHVAVTKIYRLIGEEALIASAPSLEEEK